MNKNTFTMPVVFVLFIAAVMTMGITLPYGLEKGQKRPRIVKIFDNISADVTDGVIATSEAIPIYERQYWSLGINQLEGTSTGHISYQFSTSIPDAGSDTWTIWTDLVSDKTTEQYEEFGQTINLTGHIKFRAYALPGNPAAGGAVINGWSMVQD